MSQHGLPRAPLKAGWKRSPTGEVVRDLSADVKHTTASSGPAKKGVWQSYNCKPLGGAPRLHANLTTRFAIPALSPRTRMYIGTFGMVVALAGMYGEPFFFPEQPSHQTIPSDRNDVLIDAKDGERVPISLRMVDRKATRGD